jgi:hypothetical protein
MGMGPSWASSTGNWEPGLGCHIQGSLGRTSVRDPHPPVNSLAFEMTITFVIAWLYLSLTRLIELRVTPHIAVGLGSGLVTRETMD